MLLWDRCLMCHVHFKGELYPNGQLTVTRTQFTQSVCAEAVHVSADQSACFITILFIIHFSLCITFYNLYILTLTTYFFIASVFNAFIYV